MPGLTGILRGVPLAGTALTSGGFPANVLGGPFFLAGANARLYQTAAALCRTIIPTGTDPVTGAVTSPGADQANAVQFIDLFLSAFDLPGQPWVSSTVAPLADQPAIYLRGRFSGRNPHPSADPDVTPAGPYPPDDLESAGGERHFLGLSPQQAIAWYARLYGTLQGLPSQLRQGFTPSPTWLGQVLSSTPSIPGAQGLRPLYLAGLAAFDAWSTQNFGTGFAGATPLEQEALVAVVANPIVNAASSNGLPGLPKPLPNPVPPADAASLFSVLVLHTIQGCYALPEYGGNGGSRDPGAKPATWASIGWDGDTMPLGNSLYDADAYGPGQGPNAGYGDPAVFQPQGTYVEFRPVSTPGDDDTLATADDLRALVQHLQGIATVKIVVSGTDIASVAQP